ncbi:cryptochrome/photolyase family protein [Nocardioides pocheonensis]|uniref:Deoxyribodipyrimidine photo-lyase n=1 Tax=Nocardioides pocheonensis TaxID=661485 RepID=A0A3N0GK63_9ACTN|nr:deoxyribodipyrimidine photo-lyase [Nocardioides pocheonensis]RNM12450.1 deoxyribodipyrimidine photo-lyase [Nocardioides pocheonensis]
MTTRVLWFRRDLRLSDHPALAAAAAEGEVVGLFVVDPRLWDGAGPARRAWVAASVRALQDATGNALVVRFGDPAVVVPEVAAAAGASAVHVTAETTPGGRARDARVAAALAERGMVGQPDGTPYAVAPGSVRTGQGTAYQVFTPFARAWRAHGWDDPLPAASVEWRRMRNDGAATERLTTALKLAPPAMPAAGEDGARARWRAFLDAGLDDYAEGRDRPAQDLTSRMSPYLKVGAVHPRRLLADLADRRGDGVDRFVTELAWREFYADVLWHRPESAWRDLRPLAIPYDDPGDALDAWRTGHTGYPLVDAGMRQLLHEGWMHNRVRMITASFLTKDLHAWWPAGARHFLDHLVDGDLASNNHGWQWVAGTGTDAAPYFRVFNPVGQGKKLDPDGSYVRRWVPELAHLEGAAAHEPWRHSEGYDHGYPARIVDHDAERKVALERYSAR